MPHPNDYLIPKQYLFLLESPLNLWDFLHYKAAQNDGWAVFQRAEILHDPRLIRDRKDLNTFLKTQESRAKLSVSKESYERKTQYLIELPQEENNADLLPKPRGYHENGWVHELIGLQERWLINLFLLIEHETNGTHCSQWINYAPKSRGLLTKSGKRCKKWGQSRQKSPNKEIKSAKNLSFSPTKENHNSPRP